MSKFKITLTPVDKFFFGGDMTFQVSNDKVFNEQFSSYIIQSMLFPQQTSLLGMLRFLILRNVGEQVFKNNKIVNQTKASELIGDKGFCVKAGHKVNSFGKIIRISRVRVERDGVELDFAPLFGKIGFDGAVAGSLNEHSIKVPNLSKVQYDAKEGLDAVLTDGTNNYKLLKKGEKDDNAVFVEDRRIGISRSISTGKTDDGELFKQISYRFNNEKAKHCFVFYAEVDDVDITLYDGQMITVGGDNSQFVIGIKSDDFPSDSASGNLSVTLLSPTFLARQDVSENIGFAITKLMPFRFLTDNDKCNADASYHILNSKLKRSERYELYSPGSVFYFDNETQKKAFEEKINNKNEFKQIGYNEYK